MAAIRLAAAIVVAGIATSADVGIGSAVLAASGVAEALAPAIASRSDLSISATIDGVK